MSPLPVSQFQALVPSGTDTLCQALVKVCIKFPITWWRWFNYSFDESGAFTTSFASDICEVRNNCS